MQSPRYLRITQGSIRTYSWYAKHLEGGVIDLKQLNVHIDATHFQMHTISSVLNIKRGDYTFKIDLKDAYIHVLIHPDSRKYLCFAFENKTRYISSEYSLQSEHCPYLLFWDTDISGSLPPLSGDTGNSISRQYSPSRRSSFTTPPVSVIRYTGPGRPQVERSEIQTGSSSGYTVSGASVMPASGESFPPNIRGSGDNSTCMPDILPNRFVIQRSVPVHGITQLGLGFIPLGWLHMRPLQ